MPVTRVEPSTKLFDPARTFRYTNAANTDISKRFKALQTKAKADAKALEPINTPTRTERRTTQVLTLLFDRNHLLTLNS